MREDITAAMPKSNDDASNGKDNREALTATVKLTSPDAFKGKVVKVAPDVPTYRVKMDREFPKLDARELPTGLGIKLHADTFDGEDCREKLDADMPFPVETQASESLPSKKTEADSVIPAVAETNQINPNAGGSNVSAQNASAETQGKKMTPFMLAEYLRAHYSFKAFSAQERLAVYDETRHFYVVMKNRYFVRFVLSALEGTPYKAKLTRNLIETVFMFLVHEEALQASMQDFNRDENLVNLKNGVLDISDMTLTPHSSGDLFTYCLAVDFNPKAKEPKKFLEMLRAMFDDTTSMRLCLESMAYLLSNNSSAKKLVFFLGVPNSGKSTLARLLSHIYGQDFVSAVPLEHFGGRFELGSMMNRRLNICPEVEKISPKVVRAVKAVSGGDKQMLEDKFEDAQFGFLNMKFLWSANLLPEIPARLKLDEGFFSRIGIVYFSKAIADSDRQDNYDMTLFEEEGEGIVLLLMNVLHDWHCQGHVFTKAEQSEIQMDLLRGYDTQVERAFVKECLVFESGAFISNNLLHGASTSFCKKYGKPIRPVDELKALLVKIYPTLKRSRKRVAKDGNPIAGLSGLRLRDEKVGQK